MKTDHLPYCILFICVNNRAEDNQAGVSDDAFDLHKFTKLYEAPFAIPKYYSSFLFVLQVSPSGFRRYGEV